MDGTRQRWVSTAAIACSLLIFVTFVLDRMLWRSIHVDEFQNVSNSQILVRFGLSDSSVGIEPWLVLLGHLTRGLEATDGVLVVGRLLCIVVAIGSLGALARVQPFLTTPTGQSVAFLALLSSTGLWRHGIEVRHDLLQLPAMVALLWATRRAYERRIGVAQLAITGAIVMFSILNCFKAAALVGLPSLALVIVTARRDGPHVLRSVVALAWGAAATVFATMAFLLMDGLWDAYLTAVVKSVAGFGVGTDDVAVTRFSAVPLLKSIFMAEPHLLGFALAGCLVLLRQASIGAIAPGSGSDARFFFLLALGYLGAGVLFLLINPNPYPYNESIAFPFFVLTGLAGASLVLDRARDEFVYAALLMVHLLGFAFGFSRDPWLQTEGGDQRDVIALAEDLTGPDDPVLDGAGLVPTRPPASRHWLLHSTLMAGYVAGRRESFAHIIESSAPPVAIMNYRWRWFSEADRGALTQNYARISRSVWVLAARGDRHGHLRVRRAGRYLVPSDVTFVVQIGSVSVTGGDVVFLPAGEAAYTASERDVELWWIGPRMNRLPALAESDAFFPGVADPF